MHAPYIGCGSSDGWVKLRGPSVVSIGHADPGAIYTVHLLRALSDYHPLIV